MKGKDFLCAPSSAENVVAEDGKITAEKGVGTLIRRLG